MSGRTEGPRSGVSAAPVGTRGRAGAMVDVIVPVYRGVEETRACIESVLAAPCSTAREVIVIDDASPEPEMRDFLRGLAGRVTLLENERNLGFVATANRGMMLHPDRDVVLLNSDAVVANDWLDRLRECAWRDEETGTVTPFSNNATICSYPGFCRENAMPGDVSVAELDALFREANRGESVEIPTAVGFCMYIRRDCLEQVGVFDAERFGRGYGEENEFCFRAARYGWRHLLCADTFVYHAGGVSFGDERREQQESALAALTALHPDYEAVVRAFVVADAPNPYRFAVDMARVMRQARATARPAMLVITGEKDGALEVQLNRLAESADEGAPILLLQACAATSEGRRMALSRFDGAMRNAVGFDVDRDYATLLRLLEAAGVGRIRLCRAERVHPRFLRLASDLGVPCEGEGAGVCKTRDFFTRIRRNFMGRRPPDAQAVRDGAPVSRFRRGHGDATSGRAGAPGFDWVRYHHEQTRRASAD